MTGPARAALLSVATVLAQGLLATSHSLRNTPHKAAALRSSKAHLPRNQPHFSEGRRILGSLLFFMKSTHLFALQKGSLQPLQDHWCVAVGWEAALGLRAVPGQLSSSRDGYLQCNTANPHPGEAAAKLGVTVTPCSPRSPARAFRHTAAVQGQC